MERSVSVQRADGLAAGKAGFSVMAAQQGGRDGTDLLATCIDAFHAIVTGNATAPHSTRTTLSLGIVRLNILECCDPRYLTLGTSECRMAAHDWAMPIVARYFRKRGRPPPFHASDRHEAFLLASTAHHRFTARIFTRKSRLTKAPASTPTSYDFVIHYRIASSAARTEWRSSHDRQKPP